jgi:cobalt-zinc-cadmium efflux system outer membrane protein
MRARSALAQASAEREAAEAEELAARSTLGGLFGVNAPVGEVSGSSLDLTPRSVEPTRSLEVRLADAEIATAEAALAAQRAERRLDPAVGLGVRHVRETGDFGLVAGVSMPLRIFDRNQGNIASAEALLAAARARRATVVADVTARARNDIAMVEAAERRVRALEQAGLPEAAEALRLTRLSYQEGRASLLELIDAQNSYTAAQRALTEARLALALATAELGRISAQ